MLKIARWTMAHRRIVVVGWIVATVGIFAVASSVGKKTANDFTLPGNLPEYCSGITVGNVSKFLLTGAGDKNIEGRQTQLAQFAASQLFFSSVRVQGNCGAQASIVLAFRIFEEDRAQRLVNILLLLAGRANKFLEYVAAELDRDLRHTQVGLCLEP